MPRLIVISFAALGWCFYVMSGGPDFEPRGLRSAQIVEVAPEVVPAASDTRIEQLVTNVAVRVPPVRIAPQPVAEDVVEFVADDTRLATFATRSVFEGQSANITLASLEDGVTGLTQTADDSLQAAATTLAEPEKDIREISGTRVNMRDGPGTIYPIVGKATIGQKVEVLSDSGTGWLRLRLMPQRQLGWVSASLVTKSSN